MSSFDRSDNFETPSDETYEAKLAKLQDIISRLDNSETPIDRLAEDVKLGARLIKELEKTLKEVETEVKDAFEDLEDYQASKERDSNNIPF